MKRLILLLLGLATVPSCCQSQSPTRNAIFNGSFLEGVTGWAVLGPGYESATLSADKSQHAQTLVTELIVSAPGMDRSFTLYSPYLLRVRPGSEYQLSVRMAGSGQFCFGAFEYDEAGAHLGNSYSDRYVLTPEFQQFSFTYKPTPNATGIRPAIAFLEATDGAKMDVHARLRSFELPVSADEFAEMCASWPEYAKDQRFAAYEGFSETELAELRKLESADAVLPPYRPISMKTPGDFTLTTSRVQFGSSVLPQRITVLGQEVLARPIELSVTYGDGARLRGGTAKPKVSCAPTRATLSGQFGSGSRTIAVRTELLYDAFLICTVTFPASRRASITEASLTLPFAPDVARYISYDRSVAPGEEGSPIFGYGPIPQAGEQVETKATIGSAVMGEAQANDWKPGIPAADGLISEWQRGFPQMLWIGDETRGLSLVSLSTQGYRAAPGAPTVRLTRGPKSVDLTYRFITETVPLNKARTLQFALQIMPPKPVRRDWLSARYNSVFPGYPEIVDESLPLLEERLKPGAAADALRPYLTAYDVIRSPAAPQPWQPRPGRPYRDIGFLWYTLWAMGARPSGQGVGGCSTPLVGHPERLAKIVRVSEAMGHLALPYFAATHIAAEDPAGYYYVERTDEWTQLPRVPRPAYLRPTCPNSLFSAYLARGIGRLIDEYAIQGVYFDNCYPLLCQNTKHGCGYVDDAGVVQPTIPLLGFRKLFMMVRTEFARRGKNPFILTHAGMYPGSISFIDAELQGEGTYGSEHTEMFTLGEWRARWLGCSQFGVQMTYLPAFGYGLGPNTDMVEQERIGTPRLLAMALLHGTAVWNQYLDSALLYRAWTVLDELDEPNATFVPYWQWSRLNRALNEQGVYASAYMGDDRLVLVLSNLSAEEQQVSAPLAEIKTMVPAVTQAADHMHDLPVRVDGGMVRCTIGAKDFRLLSFTK